MGSRDNDDKTFAEFFAGIGLVHEALRRSGWRCVYANDIDPHKERLYLSHFGEAPYWHREDIWNTERVAERIGDTPFLATASFPCTDMSLAGRMRGFDGAESSTFFGFTRALQQLPGLPRLVLLENVLGLLTSRGGAGFAAAAEHLAELGYWVDAWRLDARHFVPQSRPRLFLAGYAAADMPGLVSPDRPEWRDVLHGDESLRPPRLRQRIEATPLKTGWALMPLPTPPQAAAPLTDVLDLDPRQDWWDARQVRRHWEMMSDAHRAQVRQWQESSQWHAATAFRRIRQRQQRLEVRFDGIAGCLRTPRGGSARQIVVAAGQGQLLMRWMSPREYARLQGAGDYRWADETAASRVLFGFGDAVCVPAIQWIDQHVLTPCYRHCRCEV